MIQLQKAPVLSIEITEIKVFPVNEEKLKAYVTIVLNHCFVIRDLKVIAGAGGLFVAMPSKRRKDGTFKDIAHPVNHSTRALFERKVLDAYSYEIERLGGNAILSALEAESGE